MNITRQEVENVAMLARLGLNEAEMDKMAAEMSAILGYISKLNELDTSDVEPSSVSANEHALRPDLARPSLPLAEVLANAPQTDGEFIRFVPIIAAVGKQSSAETAVDLTLEEPDL